MKRKLNALERRLDALTKAAERKAAESEFSVASVALLLLRGDLMRSRIMRYWPEWNDKIPEFLKPEEIEGLTGITEDRAREVELAYLKQKYGIYGSNIVVPMKTIEEIRRESRQYALEMMKYPNSKTIADTFSFANALIGYASREIMKSRKG